MTDLTFDPAALRALLDAASPAPWAVECEGGYIVHGTESTVAEAYGERDSADAAFIAAARNELPALLDLVDRLDRARDGAEFEQDQLRMDRDGARQHVHEMGEALFSIGDQIGTALGYEPQNRVTVNLTSELDRLIRERDLLRESRDEYRESYAAAREELAGLHAESRRLGDQANHLVQQVNAACAARHRIAEAHHKHVDAHGGTYGECNECGNAWPCPTYVWATTDRDPLSTWDPADDVAAVPGDGEQAATTPGCPDGSHCARCSADGFGTCCRCDDVTAPPTSGQA
jgi:RNA polymerase-binding transcription factor DksA